jgi:signal transduction histidine kinase
VNEKILIIEDDPASLYGKTLDLTAEGYSILEAGTADDGLRIAQEKHPDLIVLDFRVPYLVGFDVLKRLKSNFHTKNTPILFLADKYDDPQHVEQGLSLGADTYLTKPISTKDLLAHIRSAVKVGKAQKEMRRIESQFTFLLIQDIKDYIAATKGSIEFALMSVLNKLDEEEKEIMAIAQNALDQQTLLINEMLDLASHEAGKIQLTKEPSDMAALLEYSISETGSSASHRGISINTVIEGTLPQLDLDRRKIHQVLLAFLTNAIQFTPDGASVTVAAEHEQVSNEFGKILGQHLHISVADSAPTIAKEEIPLVLDRYEQARQGRISRYKGLGLTIAKNIVLAHNGNIWVESEEGKGTSFHFTLPI